MSDEVLLREDWDTVPSSECLYFLKLFFNAIDDDDSELSAFGTAVCVGHGSDVVDVCDDSMDKTETQWDETRHAELPQQKEDQST